MNRIYNPVSIVFRDDLVEALFELTKGKLSLILTSPTFVKNGIAEEIEKKLGNQIVATCSSVKPNPTISSISNTALLYEKHNIEIIIALGGGSVIDSAKGISAILGQKTGTNNWLSEHLKHKRLFSEDYNPPAIIAVPTTSGTGAEVTCWGTIWDDDGMKYSLSHPSLFASNALLCSQLTMTLPIDITISTGLDALSHSLESIWNNNSNPISMTYAGRSVQLLYYSLKRIVDEPDNKILRSELQAASLLGGLAISSTKTALAHSISYPLTGHFGLSHGLACSFTLPEIARFNGESSKSTSLCLAKLFGVNSLNEAVNKLESFLKSLSFSKTIASCIKTEDELKSVSDKLISPQRAENNIARVDSKIANKILLQAYRRTLNH